MEHYFRCSYEGSSHGYQLVKSVKGDKLNPVIDECFTYEAGNILLSKVENNNLLLLLKGMEINSNNNQLYVNLALKSESTDDIDKMLCLMYAIFKNKSVAFEDIGKVIILNSNKSNETSDSSYSVDSSALENCLDKYLNEYKESVNPESIRKKYINKFEENVIVYMGSNNQDCKINLFKTTKDSQIDKELNIVSLTESLLPKIFKISSIYTDSIKRILIPLAVLIVAIIVLVVWQLPNFLN